MLHITLYITQAALALTLFFMWFNLVAFQKMRKQALDTIDMVSKVHEQVEEKSRWLDKEAKIHLDWQIAGLGQRFEHLEKLSEKYKFTYLNQLADKINELEDKLEAKFPNP